MIGLKLLGLGVYVHNLYVKTSAKFELTLFPYKRPYRAPMDWNSYGKCEYDIIHTHTKHIWPIFFVGDPIVNYNNYELYMNTYKRK